MIDVFDPIFHGAEVDVRHCDAITEVHLDECPLDVTLKNSPPSEKGGRCLLPLLQGLGLVAVPGSGLAADSLLQLGASVCVPQNPCDIPRQTGAYQDGRSPNLKGTDHQTFQGLEN